MVVFYSIYDHSGSREYCFTSWLGDIIFEDIDLSYWAVPGTLEY